MLVRIGKTSSIATIAVVWPIVVLLFGFWIPIAVWVVRYATITQSANVIRSSVFLHALWITSAVAGATTLASLILAYPMALIWWNSSKTVSTWLARILFLPLIVGLLARNYSWMGLLAGRDLLSSLGLILVGGEHYLYTIHSVIAVMTYIFIPIAFFVLIYALSSVSQYEIEAARTLGATDYEIVRKLVVPHTFRQSVIGCFLIFANAFGYFVTPHMLGGGNFDMLGNLIWNNLIKLGLFDEASSLSIALLMVLIPFYALSFVLIVRSRKRVLGR